MGRQKNIHPKYAILYIAIIFFFLVIIPYISIQLFPKIIDQLPGKSYHGEIPDTVKVYITKEEEFETIQFETYIEGVVASEMPASFDFEALKAQAVASRTYALGRINAGSQLCDTVHCQVYRSTDIPDAVQQAVRETKGQVLLHNGKLAAQALYFSSSAGDTENAEEVFSNPYPYLVSVTSDQEPNATHKKERITMEIKEFSRILRASLPELDFGTIRKGNIKILSHTAGGRVKNIKAGKEVISGADIRNAFSLYSTRFTISFSEDKLTITTSGSGHGVGMSQYGADGLAKKGKDYRQILAHYYQGTTVSR